jgi:DNA-binding transcriptional LysR family regulator
MDTFNALPIFVAVIKHGGFSAASRVLGISKSAISKRITLLEQQLATRLIHRTTRKLSLTEAGERFYQHALQATICAQNAEDAVGELLEEPQGLLKIHVPMSFGMSQMSSLIAAFLKRYPNVSIEMLMDDQHIDIIKQGFDLSFRAGELADSSFIARPLAPLNSVICMAPSYAAKTTLQNPSDLKQEICLLHSYSSNAHLWEFSDNNQTLQIQVKGNFCVNNSHALKRAVIEQCGIARLPTYLVSDEIRSGKLIALFSQYTLPAKHLYALFPQRSYVPAKVRCFLDFSLEYFGEDIPYWDKGI